MKADGTLGAKLADLGTAVRLSSVNELVIETVGTTGYAGELLFVCVFVVLCSYFCLQCKSCHAFWCLFTQLTCVVSACF